MQLGLSFSFDEPAARRSDPETSKQAAIAAKEMAARHQGIVLKALQQHGPAGKDRLAAVTSLTGVQICRRLTELQRMGLIRPTGNTVQSTAGRNEREWEAV